LYEQLAELLEVESVAPGDVLQDSPLWDSLTMLSLIALLDSSYGVNVVTADLRGVRTAGELVALVEARRA